jgi:hypothetical protein
MDKIKLSDCAQEVQVNIKTKGYHIDIKPPIQNREPIEVTIYYLKPKIEISVIPKLTDNQTSTTTTE